MKFSNFISTLAVVFLAFNADALRVQDAAEERSKEIWGKLNTLRPKEVEKYVSEMSPEEAKAACKYGIYKVIDKKWRIAKWRKEYKELTPLKKELIVGEGKKDLINSISIVINNGGG